MINKLSFLISCFLLSTAILILYCFVSRPEVIVIAKGFDKFPVSFNEYSGKDIKMGDNVVKELDTDVYVFRSYISHDNMIMLYIGYYGTRKGGRTGHNPNACYPSTGHAILDEEKVTLQVNSLEGKNRAVIVTRLIITKNGEKQIVYHWYQSLGNKILASGMQQNFYRFKTRLLYNRNDGAFIRVSAIVKDTIDLTDDDLKNFISSMMPLIEQCWPVEKEDNAH